MKRITSRNQFAVNMILDSGAYSAWAKGEDIDIDDYCKYIIENKDLLYAYVTLDVIPGSPGLKRTQNLMEESARLSHENHQYMKKKYKLSPMPVFHRGERLYWLEKMLGEGEPYIGLSPTSFAGSAGAMEWLDKIFTILTDKDGKPKVKTHGFAVASFDLMRRYPWTTCDATSWALTAAYGGIYVPVFAAGKPDFLRNPIKVGISKYEKSTRTPPDHYVRLGQMLRKHIERYLVSDVGVTVEQCATDYRARAKAVVHFYKRFEAAVNKEPVVFRHRIIK